MDQAYLAAVGRVAAYDRFLDHRRLGEFISAANAGADEKTARPTKEDKKASQAESE